MAARISPPRAAARAAAALPLLALVLLPLSAPPAARAQGAPPAALVPFDTEEIWLNLEVAEGFLIEGRYDAARAALDRCLELDPASARARFNRARLDLALGRHESAEVELALLQESATDPVERAECALKRALALIHLERAEEALRLLAAVESADPAVRLERTWLLGVADWRMNRKATAEARFAEALALAAEAGGDAMRDAVQGKIDALKSPARIK